MKVECPSCDGKGYFMTHQKDKETCAECKGTGKIETEYVCQCDTCQGINE